MNVLSLCDKTTNMVRPWANAGHDCTCIDLQHLAEEMHEGIRLIGADVCAWTLDRHYDIVFAFPPCTHLAVSGARWFKEKGLDALIEAMTIFNACIKLCEENGAPYMIENPVSTISTYWRKPDYTFDPCDYGDPYTKKTCLWVGNGFVMPPKQRVEPVQGSKMHLLPPSDDRADLRSATPMGFARAVYAANSRDWWGI